MNEPARLTGDDRGDIEVAALAGRGILRPDFSYVVREFIFPAEPGLGVPVAQDAPRILRRPRDLPRDVENGGPDRLAAWSFDDSSLEALNGTLDGLENAFAQRRALIRG